MTQKMVLPLLIGLIGVAILVSLTVWQVQRLAWKTEILAEIEGRIAAEPVSLSEALDPKVIEFASVALEGRFTGEELHVLASIKRVGAIYRVISAFETNEGQRILVDRGFIPVEAKDAPRAPVEARIVGNLRFPDETDSFTPAPDLDKNIWFVRDPLAMSEALKTDYVFVILRETSEINPPVTPLPVDTAGIPNDHLQYAITWFSLALIWLVMTGFWMARLRETGQKDEI